MKISTIYLILSLISFTIYAQTTAIPDAAFENKLISLGIDSNGVTGDVLNADVEGITFLNIGNSGISNLVGIEAFINLETLDCDTNSLTSLDLTSNLSLKELDCQQNQLTNLNITQNSNLLILACLENQLTSLDISNNLLLSDLSCQNNQLTNLDLTNNTQLRQLICHDNNLTNITFSTTQNLLEIVWCYNNQIESIDLINAPILATLQFENNNLNFLDLRNGNNTNIHTMDARGNPNLQLICVDDVDYATSTFNWNKDATAEYSTTCTLGIDDLELVEMNVYPNPVNRMIKIITNNNELIRKVEIYNYLGQLKAVEMTAEINVSNYIPGVYFLKIETQRGIWVSHKIIKI